MLQKISIHKLGAFLCSNMNYLKKEIITFKIALINKILRDEFNQFKIALINKIQFKFNTN